MTTLWLDLETFSSRSISCGTHAYAEMAEIMLAAWAIDDGKVEVFDLIEAPYLKQTLSDMIREADKVVIHNSHFDRTVLHHNGIDLPAERIHDTMVQALAHSLPGSLGKLCEILNVPLDQAKEKDGKRLINLFCKPLPANRKLRRATRETHPQEWERFIEYAMLDILAMRAVYKKLPKWNLTDTERKLWQLDQKINDNGVAIDMDLVRNAIVAIDAEQARLAERAQDLTQGVVSSATRRDAMLRHILEAYEVPLDDLKASTVERMLGNDNYPPELLELLRVRLQATTSSTAKYAALERATSSDGRLRGTLQFCGASRTGRWAGRLFQPQNLPRPDMNAEVIEAGIEALKADEPIEELAFGTVMELTSNAIRGAIIAPRGRKLVVADLSNIEGRVLAWLAGEEWKLEAFRAYDRGEGPDLYKVTAGRILGKNPEDVTKKERQEVGKVAELALGYEGGVGAFITFATAYAIDLDDLAGIARETLDEAVLRQSAEAWEWTVKQKRNTFGLHARTWIGIDGIKRAWRAAHPAISSFWADLDRAVRRGASSRMSFEDLDRVRCSRDGAWLRLILPSGRALCYPSPKIDDDKITYMGVNQFTRAWSRISTYGGKLAENATQAVARDVLAAGMLQAQREGYEIVLSVHDELITEAPDQARYSAAGLAACMSQNPAWADGLPLSAAGFEATRYRKD
jgi:DNA polymerase